MIDFFPLQHSVYLTSLEARMPGPQSPEELETLLKLYALNYRAVIISDSSLNNTPVFWKVIQKGNDSFLTDALRTGFLRRAARVNEDSGPISQRELFDLQKRHASHMNISEDHISRINQIVSKCERGVKPLLWKQEKIDIIFRQKLRWQLLFAEFSGEGRLIADKIAEDLSRPSDLWEVSGRRLVTKYLPNRHISRDQALLRRIINQAYSGNIPAEFEGNLMLASSVREADQFLPGGPQRSPEENALETEFHRALLAMPTLSSYHYTQKLSARSDQNFVLDLKKLRELHFEEIIELREYCQPDKYFDLRFAALGSPTSLDQSFISLVEARKMFFDTLKSAGHRLTKRAHEQAENQAKLYLLNHERTQEKRNILTHAVLAILARLPLLGLEYGVEYLMSLIEFTLLVRGMKTLKPGQKPTGLTFHDSEQVLSGINQILRRPDYNIFRDASDLLNSR